MKYPVLLMARELHQGGSERQMAEIALALDRSRFEPHVGTFRPQGMRGDQLRAAGVPVVQFPVYSFRSPGAVAGALQLARYIRRNKIRLVHTYDAPLTVFATPVVRYFTRAKMLSSQRGHRSLTSELHKLLRWTDHFVDGVVVNCQYMKAHLVNDEHVPERLIQVCYNGIDLERFHPASSPRPAALPASNLKEASFVIGTVCRLGPEKGLTTLIDAFADVHALHPGMKLAIVGSGPVLEQIQSRARDRGVFDNCIWQPAIPDVPLWLRIFDIFVLPSLEEALSNSLMEAMACGCPAIASRVGGNPELIEGGVTGLLFERGDAAGLAAALRSLIENEAFRRTLASAGEQFIRNRFSRSASAQRMGEIYLSAIESRRR